MTQKSPNGMNNYVALLRGINVSGQKIIRMADLRSCFEALGFKKVKTYLQSGNVIFTSEVEKPLVISSNIQNKIAEEFGFNVDVLVVAGQWIRQIAEANPFSSDSKKDIKWLHVTFPYQSITTTIFENLAIPTQAGEVVVVAEQVIYLYCPNGYGRTKINNHYFEKVLGFTATTRNWKTVLALAELSQD